MPRDERYNDMITVRTGELTDGRIFQEIEDVHGEIVRKVADVAAMQLDEAVRAKLTSLGWMPPPKPNEDDTQVARQLLAMEYMDDPVLAQKIREGTSSNGDVPRAIRALMRILSWSKK